MRISDWSSDVCSSDLWRESPGRHRQRITRGSERRTSLSRRMNTNMAKTLVEQGPVDLQAPVGAKQDDAAPQNTQEGGIFDGRAAMGIGLLIILVAMWILGYITGTDVETLLSLTIWGVMLGGIIALGGIRSEEHTSEL